MKTQDPLSFELKDFAMSNARKHVLVVDDEKDLVELLTYNLKRAGFDVSAAFTGRQALERIALEPPDLVILDIMLPELSGTEVASRIRSNPATAALPIVMLTAKSEDVDQIVGLTVGADDYIAKPFATKVLLARIDAVLRRAGRSAGEQRIVSMGGVTMNLETHETVIDGEPAKLTLTEFRLLSALIQGNGRVLSRAALMSRAMGPGVTVTERTIDVHVTAIRKKLGSQASIVKTVRGVGYRATPDLEADETTGETTQASVP
ncbi:MAG: response regulator transcription factor [Planctomycetota bacterium]|nr:response regulator transcription factor [Planctomycetota bacterium]